MRYYYTDPVAAAWMAKHFGMQFIFGDLKYPELAILRRVQRREEMTVYIHPDSEYLLQPQDGDIVIECYGDLTKGYPLQIIGKCVGISEYACRFGDETIYEKGDDFKIIQRNGKPFFWPEVEA